jgi:hypothetical protein
MKNEKTYRELFKVNYKKLVVFLLIAITLLWIDSKYFLIFVGSLIGTQIIIPLILRVDDNLEGTADEKSNINENIARYKAKLRKRKENAKWWQFWI